MRPIDESAVTGMIPGTTGVEMPRAARSSTSRQVLLHPEEELGHGEVGQAQLLGQAVPVGRQVGRSRVPGGVGGHPDRESPDGPGQLHQLDGMGQLAFGGIGIGRRVAAEGHEVLDARLAEIDQDLRQLEPGVGHADQMGHRGQAGRPQHPHHQIVGALARRPPAAVGDGHEGRPQRLQVEQRLDQAGVLGVALGGKELERERPPGRQAGRRCGPCRKRRSHLGLPAIRAVRGE